MELKEYIQSELNGMKRTTGRVLKDLLQSEYTWRPASGCNSMGLILFHVAKSEDSFLSRIQGKPMLWDSDRWYERLGVLQSEAGSHYTVDQVNAFPCPDCKELGAYFDAVRARTVEHLGGLTSDDLGKKITVLPFPGETTVASMFALIVSHSVGHFAEMSYLRGIQRGLDK
jgi:uncharacterized damage-inducible protein DinB